MTSVIMAIAVLERGKTMRTSNKEVIIKRIYGDKNQEIGYEEVAEVVRCKDCRHYVNSEHYGMMCEILVHAEQGDNFYCGYGQKKLEQEKWDV